MSELIPATPLQVAVPYERYLTRNDVAQIFSISVRTVENWRANGTLPCSFQAGGRTYWMPEKIRATVNDLIAASEASGVNDKPIGMALQRRVREPKAGNALAKSLVRDQKIIADLMDC